MTLKQIEDLIEKYGPDATLAHALAEEAIAVAFSSAPLDECADAARIALAAREHGLRELHVCHNTSTAARRVR